MEKILGVFLSSSIRKSRAIVITTPEKSWEMHEEMIKISEDFYQSVRIS